MTGRRGPLVVVALAAGALGIIAFVLPPASQPASGSSVTPPVTTATVVRATLASRQQVQGTLERAGSYALVAQQTAGVITELPAVGTVIMRGGVLYRLDGQPIRLLYGAQASWRTLELGVEDGPDVRQLKQNLRAMGYTAHGALTVDDRFDWATAAAIEDWQLAQGHLRTGVLPLGSVAFMPGPVTVLAGRALPGAPAQPGTPVLDLSSTDLVVSVALDSSLRQLVHVGDKVQIQLPQGQTTSGRVSQIGAATAVSSEQPAAGGTGQGGSSGGGPSGADAGAQGNGPPVAVPVTVSLTDPGAASGLAQVPVSVQITDTVHRGVLAVPIGALLALAQGGYAVAVQDHGTRTLVAVQPGIFDGARVEVSSPRLEPGMRVETAAQ